MMLLRLTQHSAGNGEYHINVRFEGDRGAPQSFDARFHLVLTPQDQENLRWYLEEFLSAPFDPAPTIAARIEKRMDKIGETLFQAVFQSNDDGRDLWATLRPRLNDIRVEVFTEVEEATLVPWELMQDPRTDTALALRTRAFVRTQSQAVQRPYLPADDEAIRILLVICRPGGRSDVPFRSVASRLIKSLSDEARAHFHLDVLRPATFDRLAKVLRAAKDEGRPYHVVHFDGHGAFLDMEQLFEDWEGLSDEELESFLAEIANVDRDRFSPQVIYPRARRAGRHGYLAFENPQSDHNLRLVDGQELGKLLVETKVPVLVLNACRSAHAEPPNQPEAADTQEQADRHEQVRAFGSLAQEVMDAGVAGVVAMRYNVYVVTAAQFVADLYAALVQGRTLGGSVTLGRKQLADNPLREIAYDARPLQDWLVPIVYEAAPIRLFSEPAADAPLSISVSAREAAPEQSTLDPKLPRHPDAGFFGRDETLLALDRAFDTQSIVLLHAYAGSGKTTTAAEFARWYALTGGVRGPVLFTSFEQYRPLPRVLDQIGQVFGPALEQSGVNWLALDDDQRRDVALDVLKQIPVLWIWDNVEPVTGFPAGTDSAWSDDEQQALADFLRDARATKAKFLLTSRRDEQAWLGDLPARIAVPPMPMQERVQLARALAEKHGRRISDVDDWRPLLLFTGGNPLTITVLVGQALRDRLRTRDKIEAFVAALRTGETAFEDEEADEGRARSLGASLGYGFEHAFTDDERRQLALLHFFQGFVDVDVLRTMGNPDADWCLPEMRGLTREDGMALLDRAAEIGLLTPHGGGYYTIHPALPWFFKRLFGQYYAGSEEKATRAFVEAMGALGGFYHRQYNESNRNVIAALIAEEANLLHARRLARSNEWWDPVTSTMQGLRSLYNHTGRRAEWKRLVDEIVPDFVDPATDGPLPGREEKWSLITEYRVLLAEKARQWPEAERLQRLRVDWNHRRAEAALAISPELLDAAQRNAVRTLEASLHELGEIQREIGEAACVEAYEASLNLAEQIGDQAGAATCAFNLGHAYMTLPALRDLEQAEHWYQRSLDMYEEHHRHDRAQCLYQLGSVAYERFKGARAANKPEADLLRIINDAVRFYLQALDLLPSNAVNDLAATHNALGVIYDDAGDLDRALQHYREAIRYKEGAGNRYSAARTRRNIAIALAQAGRLADARDYAHAALRDYETYGTGAAAEVQKTKELIALIEQAINEQGG